MLHQGPHSYVSPRPQLGFTKTPVRFLNNAPMQAPPRPQLNFTKTPKLGPAKSRNQVSPRPHERMNTMVPWLHAVGGLPYDLGPEGTQGGTPRADYPEGTTTHLATGSDMEKPRLWIHQKYHGAMVPCYGELGRHHQVIHRRRPTHKAHHGLVDMLCGILQRLSHQMSSPWQQLPQIPSPEPHSEPCATSVRVPPYLS